MQIISLISDFGALSYHISRVKAAILHQVGNLPIVDISHEVQPENIQQAIQVSALSRKAFKGAAIHLIGVNNRTVRHLAAFAEGQWYLAPDNGILPELLKNENPVYYQLPDYIHPYFLERHYPIYLKKILENSLEESVQRIEKPLEVLFIKPSVKANRMQVYFSYYDVHGNAVADIKREAFYQFCGKEKFRIYLTEQDYIDQIVETPYYKPSGELTAFFNQAGYLEITYVGGNASRLFGLKQNGFIIIDKVL